MIKTITRMESDGLTSRKGWLQESEHHSQWTSELRGQGRVKKSRDEATKGTRKIEQRGQRQSDKKGSDEREKGVTDERRTAAGTSEKGELRPSQGVATYKLNCREELIRGAVYKKGEQGRVNITKGSGTSELRGQGRVNEWARQAQVNKAGRDEWTKGAGKKKMFNLGEGDKTPGG
jgi:hypothetical protein